MDDVTKLAYQQSADTAEESTRCLLAAFAYLGIPESLIDLGCGPGHLPMLAAKMGINSSGVDLNAPSPGTVHEECSSDYQRAHICIEQADLSVYPLFAMSAILEFFDMALCWEVAEHLPPEAGPTLCDTAVSVLAPGGVLLWTAAVPGQGGSGHLNERPHSYWKFMLTERGLIYQPGITGTLRRVWSEVAPRAWWYGANLLVFKKPEAA